MPADKPDQWDRHALRPQNLGGLGSGAPAPVVGPQPLADVEQGSTPQPVKQIVRGSPAAAWMGVENYTLAAGTNVVVGLAPDLDTVTIYCAANGGNAAAYASLGGERFRLPAIGTAAAYALTLPARAARDLVITNLGATALNVAVFLCRNCPPPVLFVAAV